MAPVRHQVGQHTRHQAPEPEVVVRRRAQDGLQQLALSFIQEEPLHLVFAAHVLHHPDVHDGAVAEAGEPAHEDADEEDGVGGGEGGGGAHLHQSAVTILVT